MGTIRTCLTLLCGYYFMHVMDSFRPHEIRRVAKVWQDVHHQQWLVVADFAEIAGRIECVGVQLRSYIRHQEALRAEQSDWPIEEVLTYDGYWAGGPVTALPGTGSVDENWRVARLERDLHGLATHDLLAAEANAHLAEGLDQPRPLRTETLRDLRLGDVLKELRCELARQTGSMGEVFVDLHRDVERQAGNAAAVAELDRWKEDVEQTRTAINSTPKRRGRPRKY